MGTFGDGRPKAQVRVQGGCWGSRTFCVPLSGVVGAQAWRQASHWAL